MREEFFVRKKLFVEPRCYFGGGGDASALAVEQERQRATDLAQGRAAIDKQFSGFDDNFYNQRKQAYVDYAMPQLGQQFRQQQNAAQYSLANRGLTKSTQGQTLGRALGQQLAQNQQTIANQGQSQANELRRGIETQRTNLYNTLSASQDPSMAATGALNAAQAYSTPSAMVPIGQMFADWSQNYLAGKNTQTYGNALNQMTQPSTQLYFAPTPK